MEQRNDYRPGGGGRHGALGTASRLRRYPVKSMFGERCEYPDWTGKGVAGDRRMRAPATLQWRTRPTLIKYD